MSVTEKDATQEDSASTPVNIFDASNRLEAPSPLAIHRSATEPIDESTWPKGWRPYSSLFGCFLLMFNSWGLVNAYGTFLSYYQESLLSTYDVLFLNFIGSTQCFMVLSCSFVIGRLLDAGHSLALTITGSFLVVLGMFMLSICNGSGLKDEGNYGLIWLVQGFIVGLGMACFFVTSSQVAATWFKKKKGFAIGIVASGASISGLIYPIMLRFLIESSGFNRAVQYVSVLVATTCIAAVILARPNPSHDFRKPPKWRAVKTWIDTSAFRNASFCWFTGAICWMFFGFYVIFFNLEEWAAKTGVGYKGEVPPGQSGLKTYWLLSILNASSTIGRLSSSYLCDHFGALRVHTVVTFVSGLLCLILWVLAKNLNAAIAFVVIFGAFSGSVIGLPPASMAAMLGPDRREQSKLGQWTGMMYTCSSVPALIGPIIAGHLITVYDTYISIQAWSGTCLLLSLQATISVQHATHEQIDDCLRAFIDFCATSNYQGDRLQSEYDIARCCYVLLDSDLFGQNKDYVRRQFVYGLLQEEDAMVLHIVAAVLLFDGRSDESTFEMMQAESAFPRLLDLIQGNKNDDTGLHRLLLVLLCEMSRIQRLSWEDLTLVSDAFIIYLFQLIEELSDDASDPYHYPTIRVLLILNEQYMCHATSTPPTPDNPAQAQPALTNRIIKVLSSHGPAYRTFGENLILLLNRESALGPQLLILKLLYLLFTTPPTYEYFYTNDLHVLVDVIMRNLLDLDPAPDDEEGREVEGEGSGQRALLHTYLRVLCPLLRNTQLSRDQGHYKREELRKLFYLLVHSTSAHFAPVDEAVVRLVSRCSQIDWLRDTPDGQEDSLSPLVGSPPTDTHVAKRLLGMNLAEAGESSLSVVDVAAKVEKEKPVVPAPRRRRKKPLQDGTSSPVSHVTLLKPSSDLSTQNGERSPFDDDNDDQ
ncbi:hypothetical protein MBLNU459_g2032t2 [Dothideomycetes sp. NU459]